MNRFIISFTIKSNLLKIFVILSVLSSTVFSQEVNENPLTKALKWRNIGPANMSGRISDIEALDNDFTKLIIASASGGVFKSVNAGITFEPIFDNYGSASIGDVAYFQKNPDIIWVGTGEECSRNSIAWGDGIYKSVDGGKTFTNMGLESTHSIAKIITHPKNENIVYAASPGHLWGHSGDRGLFKTEDGGKTWRKLTNGLPDDGKTGAIDLLMDPKKSNTLYVAMWERTRYPNKFESGGPNGGIFKSTNGGKSWKRLDKGLPEGDLGRIGLAVYRKDPKILMAIVEHGFQPDEEDDKEDYEDMSKLGTGIYRSENGGKSWKFINRYNSRPFYYSHIYINPNDDQRVYVMAAPFFISHDGGKTLERQSTRVHGDHHSLWLDPHNPDRFYIGTDGGAALTHDHGISYNFFDNLTLAQFYAIGVDMRNPYWVYGGLQDNGTWGGPSKVRDPNGILTDHWIKFRGGDGFHAQIDPTDWRTIYVESQGGNVARMDAQTHESKGIRPRKNNIVNYDDYVTDEIMEQQKEKGFRTNPFRFSWSSPIVISPHNPQTVFFAGNHLFKSVDRGENWTIISPDLSKNDPVDTQRETGGITSDITGAETYGTIITISESPLKPGVMWVGTDDGNVQLTRDGGLTWNNVVSQISGVPQGLWVSRVEASHFEEGRAYVSFDGHRSDNFKPWVYVTEDFGSNWQNISSNIPDGHSVYVVKEDLQNENLLFAGTEFSLLYSLDRGQTWTKLMNGLPTVAIHDLVIHPRDNDLIAGTHGRGIFVLDDITPLQQMTDELMESDVHLFDQREFIKWERIQKSDPRKGHQFFSGENYDASAAPIFYYLKSAVEGDVELEITNLEGESYKAILDNEAGLNKYNWSLRLEPGEMSERQIDDIEAALEEEIDAVETDEERIELEKRFAEFKNAPTDAHRRKAIRGLTLTSGFQRGRRGVSRGKAAVPGNYRLTLTVGEKKYVKSFTLIADPIMDKNK